MIQYFLGWFLGRAYARRNGEYIGEPKEIHLGIFKAIFALLSTMSLVVFVILIYSNYSICDGPASCFIEENHVLLQVLTGCFAAILPLYRFGEWLWSWHGKRQTSPFNCISDDCK